MGKYDKILSKILSGLSDKDISFLELCNALKHLGFKERIREATIFFIRMELKKF